MFKIKRSSVGKLTSRRNLTRLSVAGVVALVGVFLLLRSFSAKPSTLRLYSLAFDFLVFIRGLRPPSAASAAPEVRLFSFFVRSHLKRGAQATLRVGLCPTRRGFVKKTRELAHKTMGLDRRAKLKTKKPSFSLRSRKRPWGMDRREL